MKFIRNLIALIALTASLNAFALFEDCKDLFPNQQIPTSSQAGRDLCFDGFAIYYSPKDKKPIYAVEKLNQDHFSTPRPRRSNQFYEEARLPFAERSLLSDYRGSGYDRGHNAPAGDMNNERSMAQSFSLANMMPQARQNNQGIWAKNVEEPTRAYVKRSVGNIYVFTGSTGSIGSIGKSKVTIPSNLFKLVYDSNKNVAWAYWIENSNEARMTPPITYQELMEKTGIDFHLPINKDTNQQHAHQTPRQNPHPQPLEAKQNKDKAALVGGWYPVFFDEYSANKLNNIIANIKAGKVASIQIQYDHNVDLAKQLATEIEVQTNLHPSLLQSSPPESPTVTYERNRVTLIIRSK